MYLLACTHDLAGKEGVFVHQSTLYRTQLSFLQHTYGIPLFSSSHINRVEFVRSKKILCLFCLLRSSLPFLVEMRTTVWEEEVCLFVNTERCIRRFNWFH
jgi:hypothetical protein